MALNRAQLNDVLKANATASTDQLTGAQNRNAALSQLITGADLKSQEEQRQRAANISDVKSLRGLLGKDAKINVGDITVDPREYSMEKSLTPGQKAADTAYGKEYADYVAGGGSEAAKKNLGLLEDVQTQLRAKGDKAPNMLERAAQYLPDAARTFLTPDIKQQEDQVRTAVQSSLRQTLGAQFTEKEGEGLMRRAYDPRLSPAQNLKKMEPEINAIKQQIEQKRRSAQMFENTGSLVGLGAMGPQAPVSQSQPQTKQVGGKTYVRTPEGWVPQ